MEYIIALGGNLGDSVRYFAQAVSLISARIGPVQRTSTMRETEPLLNPQDPAPNQRAYLNGAVLVSSDLRPEAVLGQLLRIEAELGRVRGSRRWEPRTIDLDLICCGQAVVDTEALTLPHPELHRRTFVLEPLQELLPAWRHPITGKTPAEMLRDLE